MKSNVIAIGAFAVLVASTAHAQNESPIRSNVVIGDGKGYVAQIVVGDIAAAALLPAIALPAWSDDPWIWTIPLSGAPLALTGPILHVTHGRWVPAAASFLGWASVVATGWFAGAELSMAFGSHPTTGNCFSFEPGRRACTFTPDNSATGLALGIGIGVAGAIMMTFIDAWMARPIKPSKTHVSFSPDGVRGSF